MIRTCLASAAVATCLLATPAIAHDPDERTLVWADEFNEPALDRDKWIVIGTDFWVNNEQQAYVDSPEVLSIVEDVDGADGGALMLRPVYKPGVDPHPEREADFLSGRVESKGKADFTYGRAEARIKMPDAVGVWPAFWMLGNDQWPGTGEIDIMEYVGEKDWTAVALHGPGYSGDTPLVNRYFFEDGTDVTDWHVYSVDWSPQEIIFKIDGKPTYRATRAMVEHYGRWAFDTPKFVILNFALGGAYPSKTNGIEKPYDGLPQQTVDRVKKGDIAMYVDWVRVER